MNNILKDIEPKDVWHWFYEISQIPRGTFKEQKILAYLINFAKAKNLQYIQDKAGNILIYKQKQHTNSSKIVCLQAHCDMVWNKSSSSNFDFETSAIEFVLNEDTLKANNTTLGADNGVGLATILAILDSKDIIHCDLEALITVSEEVGLTGASNLDLPLKSSYLINLDSEEDNVITIGSAGACDLDVSCNYNSLVVKQSMQLYELKIDNLKSGHSGVDIHKNRANAIKILARILYILNKNLTIELCEIQGGTARNIIPLCAWANFFIEESSLDKINLLINNLFNNIKKEYEVEELFMSMSFSKITENNHHKAMDKKFQNNLLRVLNATFSGVFKLNQYTKKVETSGNLASCICKDNTLEIKTLLRSSSESSLIDIKHNVLSVFELLADNIKISQDGYKPWEPNYNSFLTKLASNVYENTFKEKPIVEDVHAGLEPSMIDKQNKLDKISIGPNIFDPHSPNESIGIASTQKFYIFLKQILKELAK